MLSYGTKIIMINNNNNKTYTIIIMLYAFIYLNELVQVKFCKVDAQADCVWEARSALKSEHTHCSV